MTDEILADTKMLLGLSGDEQDSILLFYIKDISNAILSYCNIEFLPVQLYGLTARIAADMIKRGGDSIVSLTEGERRIEFLGSNVINSYSDRLEPFRNRTGRLPSENSVL